uniref:Ig-like domain-containing protein n=1 Tax=Globodera rostochiensis TaxID=31243 RepID=A0A914GR01_GLORO
MKRFSENSFFQKFLKERRHETTTTTTTEYKKYSNSHHEEFSSSNGQKEEHFYGRNGNSKSLHFTQSLQDAFQSNSPEDDHRLSKEFPPLQREPRHYQPRNIREEQKELSEHFDGDTFIQSQQQKLFEFREQFNNGNIDRAQQHQQRLNVNPKDAQAVPATQPTAEGRHFRTMAMKRTTERQQQFVERRWQHMSMPPLERHRLLQAQQQTPHDLQADAAERRRERGSSRGFSPFPVFGPFMTNSNSTAAAAAAMPPTPPRQHSMPPQQTCAGAKRTSVPPPSDEMSMSMTTSQYKIVYDQPQHPAPMAASSSGDEWQSAYEFLPQSTKHFATLPPKTAPKPQHLSNSANFVTFAPSPTVENVQCTFNLNKLNAYSRQLATKCIWPMRDSQMFQSVVSVGDPTKVQQLLNESTTLSERQANDEVRKFMGASGTISPPAQLHISQEAQSRQSVKVEFNGPVHFVHTTNLNVSTNNRDNKTPLAEPIERKNGQLDDIQRDKMTISPPVERYIDSVCDFGPIFAEIGQTLKTQNQNYTLTPTGNFRKVEQTKQHNNKDNNNNNNDHVEHKSPEKTAAFTYRIQSAEQQKPFTRRRPSSHELEAQQPAGNVPYLVESTSQCHFARVSAITQEWRLARVPDERAECAVVVTARRQMCRSKDLFARIPNVEMPAYHQNSLCRRPSANYSEKWAQNSASSYQHQTYQSTTNKTTVSPPQCHQKYNCASIEACRWRRHDDAEDALRSALTDVQREQAAARAYSKRCQCAEAERIERAILTISEGLRRPLVSVSKAQAEVKEELLRVRLAQLILNLDPDNDSQHVPRPSADKQMPHGFLTQDYKEALRAPIALLRQKLRLLEHRLVHEDADGIGTELRQISATPPLLRSEEQRRRQETLSVRNGEIARMTPLIGILQHKLSALDGACTRRVHTEQMPQQQQQQFNYRIVENESRPTLYAERKTVHELLKRISGEIETIHELCRRDEVRDRLDAVLGVLKRVAASVDQITATLDGTSGSDAQRRTAQADQMEQQQSAQLEQHFAFEMEDRTRCSPSKLEQAIERREAEKASQIQNKKRTEQLMKEMMAMFRQQQQNQKQFQCQQNQNQQQQSSSTWKNQTLLAQQRLPPTVNRQWVHAVELSAYFARHPTVVAHRVQAIVLTAPGAEPNFVGPAHPTRLQQCAIDLHATQAKGADGMGSEKGTGGKERAYDRMKKRRFDQTPRIIRQQTMPNTLQYDEDVDHIPAFKIGACPPSYLPRDEMPKRQTQSFQQLLEVPTAQQHKFLQLHQQQHYLCSSQDEEAEEDDDDMTASSTSALDSSSLNVPILFRKKLSMCSEPVRETAILTDEEESQEESITEVFFLRRRRKHAMLNAVIYPETKVRLRASLRHGNNFEVVVERVSDCGRDSVVMVSEEFIDKRVLIRSGAPVRHSTVMEEMESSDEGFPTSSPGMLVDAHTKMAISISARSDRDSVHAFLEQIPCGQIGLKVQAPSTPSPTMAPDQRSGQSVGMANSLEWRDSVFRDIKVSEGVADLENSSRSLRSSRRSSQKSLLMIHDGMEEVEDIPAYVIKMGSTASITCELNNDCVELNSKIEWFRGQNEQIVPLGNKFERIREDWTELLVISDVQPEDGQLYSVKINGELYPVAYLIVEEHRDDDEMEGSTPSGQTVVGLWPEPQFLTAPQTQFVLQCETAIISVQMNRANLNVIWHKDGQLLDAKSDEKCADGRPRIWMESTTTGWYRIIVNDVQFSDQGYYFAQLAERQTNVQLIVEERIDEREVQVSSAETDDEELGDYLVPLGSTATIACELENVSFGYELHWQRNHKDLDDRIASGDGKFEHVVNKTKHYLIIHNAQPDDSGVYCVRLGDAMFKVAQITISGEFGQQNLSGSRLRRISSQSLNRLEKDAQTKAKQKAKSPQRG